MMFDCSSRRSVVQGARRSVMMNMTDGGSNAG
jgi:hypothetical protein